VCQYKDFFNDKRPHQGIGNRTPAGLDDEASEEGADDHLLGLVRRDPYLGGLLKSYRRAA